MTVIFIDLVMMGKSPCVTIQTFAYNSNNIEVYEEPVPRTKKHSHDIVKFEAGEQNRTVYEKLY